MNGRAVDALAPDVTAGGDKIGRTRGVPPSVAVSPAQAQVGAVQRRLAAGAFLHGAENLIRYSFYFTDLQIIL